MTSELRLAFDVRCKWCGSSDVSLIRDVEAGYRSDIMTGVTLICNSCKNKIVVEVADDE